MKKEKKVLVIESLAAQLALTPNFYVVDLEGMNAQKTSMLRRECFTQNIKLVVVKNTLLRRLWNKRALRMLPSSFPCFPVQPPLCLQKR